MAKHTHCMMDITVKIKIRQTKKMCSACNTIVKCTFMNSSVKLITVAKHTHILSHDMNQRILIKRFNLMDF